MIIILVHPGTVVTVHTRQALSYFASQHNVCGSLDTIDQRFPAAIKVVKFTLIKTENLINFKQSFLQNILSTF